MLFRLKQVLITTICFSSNVLIMLELTIQHRLLLMMITMCLRSETSLNLGIGFATLIIQDFLWMTFILQSRRTLHLCFVISKMSIQHCWHLLWMIIFKWNLVNTASIIQHCLHRLLLIKLKRRFPVTTRSWGLVRKQIIQENYIDQKTREKKIFDRCEKQICDLEEM
jgi:hypothetical protein